MRHPTISDLRRYAIARTFFKPTSLPRAVARLGFVQIDPISSPAPAHDLILRHRVKDYRKGDMAQAYPALDSEEAFFINHGYLPPSLANALWSNKPPSDYLSARKDKVNAILAFAQEYPEIHAKILNQYLGHKSVANNWGGSGQEGTQLLQRMHCNGLLRIVKRHKGQRVYGLRHDASSVDEPETIVHQCIQMLAQTYAPFTHSSLIYMARLLTHCRADLKARIQSAIQRAPELLNSAIINGQCWYWPRDEKLTMDEHHAVRLLTPFDPLVWDRARFEQFWGWAYKFEAYKPAHERKFGYYALPILWRDTCIGWANLTVQDAALHVDLGYVVQKPADTQYQLALDNELTQLSIFLNCPNIKRKTA